MSTGGNLEAIPVESVHAWENVELLIEQCFEALFTLMARVNFDASIFDCSKLDLQLFGISRVAIHELFESTYFS